MLVNPYSYLSFEYLSNNISHVRVEIKKKKTLFTLHVGYPNTFFFPIFQFLFYYFVGVIDKHIGTKFQLSSANGHRD